MSGQMVGNVSLENIPSCDQERVEDLELPPVSSQVETGELLDSSRKIEVELLELKITQPFIGLDDGVDALILTLPNS